MLALRALSPPRGDAQFVALPSFTCAAVGAAVAWSGFSPLFVDVEADGWHLHAAALDAALAKHPGRVAATIACATFGTPPAADQARAWEGLAAIHGVPLLFDAAEGLGTIPPIGVATVYSFEATKPLGTGEGGAVLTTDGALAAELRRLANYGLEGGQVRGTAGLNGKLSELGAAAALAALDAQDIIMAAWGARSSALRERLAGLDVTFQRGATHSPWSSAHILLPTAAARVAAVAAAEALDVEVRTLWDPPLHRQPAWAADSAAVTSRLTTTDDLAARCLSLPMAADLNDGELDRVAEVVRLALRPTPRAR
jgi:dTDP-4-amino-4,6-dideoxygalactose transaminase